MRYKRTLTHKQMEYLILNKELSNEALAKKLKTTKKTISTYKSRARKKGIFIPKEAEEEKTAGSIMKEIYDTQEKKAQEFRGDLAHCELAS